MQVFSGVDLEGMQGRYIYHDQVETVLEICKDETIS